MSLVVGFINQKSTLSPKMKENFMELFSRNSPFSKSVFGWAWADSNGSFLHWLTLVLFQEKCLWSESPRAYKKGDWDHHHFRQFLAIDLLILGKRHAEVLELEVHSVLFHLASELLEFIKELKRQKETFKTRNEENQRINPSKRWEKGRIWIKFHEFNKSLGFQTGFSF